MRSAQMETPGIAVGAVIQAQKQSTDASIINEPGDQLKAHLLTRAARAGVNVFEMASGGFAVGRSYFEVPDLRSLRRVLAQLGAPA